MTVAIITPPVSAAVIDLADAKAHCRVEHDDDDALIQAYIDAAIGHLNGPRGWMGRSISPQTLELALDAFPTGARKLPFGPVTEIVSITYIDPDGAEQTLDDAAYRLLSSGELALAYGETYPSTRSQPEAVKIRYEAGFEEDGQEAKTIKAAVMLMVGDLYAQRETFTLGPASTVPMSATVESLLYPLSIWSL